MAMKTASPWWFSLLFAVGLLLLFIGERPLGDIDEGRLVFSAAGALVILGMTGLRVWTFLGTTGDRRVVEKILLFSHIGVLVSLLLYITTTDWGLDLFGFADAEAKTVERFEVPMTMLWTILMVVSLVPMLMVEISLGVSRRGAFEPKNLDVSEEGQKAIESFRVREMANSGLTIALAAAFLMATCNLAEQENVRRDVSYFKTSSPGSSTVNLVKGVGEQVNVLMFFPEVSEVTSEVRGYFQALEAESGNLVVEEHDRYLSAALAKKHKVNSDGSVVFVYGDKDESLKLTVDPKRLDTRAARTELRELDSKVNTALMKLVRQRRTAYFTVGHGELNDPDSEWAKQMRMKSGQIKQTLRNMNYTVKDLGLAQGLANEVPSDADLVMMIGPRQSLLDEEAASLDRYLAGGGHLLVALDPQGEADLGPLQDRLGVRFDRTPITDDKNFVVNTRTVSDRRWLVTNRFSSHASITTLSRASARAGVLFINAGSLEDVPFGPDKAAKRTHVVKSMATSFRDADNDFDFDKDAEKREQYNLVAAIEAEAKKPAAGDDEAEGDAKDGGMRAMVFSDVEIFSDLIQIRVEPAAAMFSDAVKWLGGEEHIAGEIVSEKDVYIEHTKNEDMLWFYLTIVGAPVAILVFGLWFGWWRRQRMQRRAS